MAPKAPAANSDEIKYFTMKVVGGEVTPAAALAPKTSPLGLQPKVVGEAIQKATPNWKGVKIQIEVAVQNRQPTVRVIPTATPLIIEALKATGRDRKKTKNPSYAGNIKLDDVLRIAKVMRDAKKSLSRDITGTCKEIIGTCVSLGCTIDGKSAKEMTTLINKGEVKCQ